MRKILYRLLYILQYDRVIDFAIGARTQVRLLRYKRQGVEIQFVPQGGYDLMIAGDLTRFAIHPTSHLKSNTFIEATGGVNIGRYFHVGRGLTIFSVTHNHKLANKIPYDEVVIQKPVIIGDFVWCGANVTILPGITIHEGAIIGGGSVVTKDVPSCAIVGGNPAQIISYRDIKIFNNLKDNSQFF